MDYDPNTTATQEGGSSCTGDCASCGASCKGGKPTPRYAKSIIAIASGKGGTGKSTMTCLLAGELARQGLKVGILDADLACPAIGWLYGNETPAESDEKLVFPMGAPNGVEFISMANVYDKPESPLLWYGKDQASGAMYFYTDVKWSTLDVLLVDMPAGFGDIPLQLYTGIPFDGAVLVGTPDELCDRMLKKTKSLLTMVYIPILGVIENRVADVETAKAHAEALGLGLAGAFPEDEPLKAAALAGKLASRSAPGLAGLAQAIAQMAGSQTEPLAVRE